MTYYTAAFCPCENGMYSITFPDFPEIATEGSDLSDAMFMAEDALKMALEEYAKERKQPPVPSSVDEAKAKTQALYDELDITPQGSVIYPLIAAPDMDTTPVRLSISLPKNVVSILDRKAKLAGMTRSGYIAHLASQA